MKKKNLLIVDDDKKFLIFLKTALEKYKSKFQIAFAHSITKAKEIIDSFQVDTVLTDVKMPGGSGIDLLLFLRKNHPNIKVIIMTAYGDEELKRSVLYSGAYAFLPKPIEIQNLGRVITNSFEDSKTDNFLKNISLMEILQFMNLSRYTGSLVVTAPGNKKGIIHLITGEIVEASQKDNKNIKALINMASWEKAEFSSVEIDKDVPQIPIGSMQSILMHVAKIIDEKK